MNCVLMIFWVLVGYLVLGFLGFDIIQVFCEVLVCFRLVVRISLGFVILVGCGFGDFVVLSCLGFGVS